MAIPKYRIFVRFGDSGDLYDVYNRARRDYMNEAIEKEWY